MADGLTFGKIQSPRQRGEDFREGYVYGSDRWRYRAASGPMSGIGMRQFWDLQTHQGGVPGIVKIDQADYAVAYC